MKTFKLKKEIPGMKKDTIISFPDDKIPTIEILIKNGEYFEELI